MKKKLSNLFDNDAPFANIDAELMRALKKEVELSDEWDTWCVIGDTLRGEYRGETNLAPAIMAALQDEPIIIVPAQAQKLKEKGLRQFLETHLLPVAASVAGVAVVAWMTFYSDQAPVSLPDNTVATLQSPEQVASTVPAVVAQPVADEMIVDPAHKEYVFMHQVTGGGGPMPGVAQYVRTVSNTRSASQP